MYPLTHFLSLRCKVHRVLPLLMRSNRCHQSAYTTRSSSLSCHISGSYFNGGRSHRSASLAHENQLLLPAERSHPPGSWGLKATKCICLQACDWLASSPIEIHQDLLTGGKVLSRKPQALMGGWRVVIQDDPGMEILDVQADRGRGSTLAAHEKEAIVARCQPWYHDAPHHVPLGVGTHRCQSLTRRAAQPHLNHLVRQETVSREAEVLPGLDRVSIH